MRLIDRIFSLKTVFILFSVLLLVSVAFIGLRIYKNHRHEALMQAEKESFFSFVRDSSYDEASDLWPSVYTYFRDDGEFNVEFSDLLSQVYANYYKEVYLDPGEDPEAYTICRVYYSFIDKDEFDMVVSSIYEDYLYERIDYHTFLGAMNDFFLFSMYKSPKIVELLDIASQILYSRESFLRGESKQRTGDFQAAIDLYKNVPAMDVIYYPRALENIDTCIELLKEKVRNGG